MAGDTTKQMIRRISWLPDRDASDNGELIAGQDYDDVFIMGGVIQNVDLTIDVLNLDTPLPVTSGGTGANTAALARTALDVQQYSANLDTFSGLTFSTSVTLSGASDSEVGSTLAIKTYVDNAITGGAIPDGDKGDIIVSSSASVWTIDNEAVTFAKIQDVSANTLIGSVAGGTVEEISLTSAGRSLLDDANSTEQRSTLGLGALAVLNTVNNSTWSGDDLEVVNGGTGASNAAGARTNLSVYSQSEADARYYTQAQVDAAIAAGDSGLTFLGVVTASASATLDFTSLIDGTYDEYIFKATDLIPASNGVDLRAFFSTDNGGSFYSSNYSYIIDSNDDSGGSDSYTASSDNRLNISSSTVGYKMGNAATGGFSFTLNMSAPSNASTYTKCYWKGLLLDPSGNFNRVDGAGSHKVAADVDAVRFAASSGNIASGSIALYGVAKV